MRLIGILDDEEFKEYVRTSFELDHEEVTLETWLEKNPDEILENSRLLIIGRQVTTNLGGFIDSLALDQQGYVSDLYLHDRRHGADYSAARCARSRHNLRLAIAPRSQRMIQTVMDKPQKLARPFPRGGSRLQPSQTKVIGGLPASRGRSSENALRNGF